MARQFGGLSQENVGLTEKLGISICNSGAKRARGAPLLRNMITHRREKFWFYRHDVNDHPSVRPCVHPSMHANVTSITLVYIIHL